MNKTALLLTSALVAVGFSATSYAGKALPGARQTTAVPAKAGHTSHFYNLRHSVVSTESFYGTAYTGFDTVHSQSVSAPKGGTLAISAMSQYCSFFGSYGQHQMSLVTLVDGTYVDYGPYAGATQNSAACNLPNWQGIYAVGAGTHTVTFQDYVDAGSVYIARSTQRTDIIP